MTYINGRLALLVLLSLPSISQASYPSRLTGNCFDFSNVDQNKDGRISRKEWNNFIASGCRLIPKMTLQESCNLFAATDNGDPENGNYGASDGHLSKEEYLVFLSSLQ